MTFFYLFLKRPNHTHDDGCLLPLMSLSPGRVAVSRAKVIHRRRVDVEAAADIDRLHIGPRSHDVLQRQVRQLSAISEVEPFYQRAPAQQDFDGRVSDVETCREVNGLAPRGRC